MTPDDFIYASNFTDLTTDQIQSGIDAVSTMFYGVPRLWAILGDPIMTDKRTLCINLLVAWWLANLFPASVTGVMADGGLPLSSKSIGGTSLTRMEIEGLDPIMKSLLSNTFGLQAYFMIRTAPEMAQIYG